MTHDPFAGTLGGFKPPQRKLTTINGHTPRTATPVRACIAGRDYQPNVPSNLRPTVMVLGSAR